MIERAQVPWHLKDHAQAEQQQAEEEEEAKAAAMRAAAEAAQAEWQSKQEGRSWGVGGPMAPPGAQEAKPQPLPSLNLWQQLNLWQ